MEEDRKKPPSLPPNYVSLAQLQERWQRKQREKEEEEEQKRREKEEEEERKRREKEEEEERKKREKEEEEERKRREREEEEERRRREKEEEELKRRDGENQRRRSENRERSDRRPPYRYNRRKMSEKGPRAIGMSEGKLEGSEIGAIVINDGESRIGDLKKKKKNNNKRKKWKRREKTRAKEDLTLGTEQLFPGEEDEAEKIPVAPHEGDHERGGVTSEFQRNGKKVVVNVMDLDKKLIVGIGRDSKKAVVNGRDSDKKLTVGIGRNGKNVAVNDMDLEKKVTVEIGRQFEDISLSGGRGGSERDASNMRGGQRKYSKVFGSIRSWRPQRPRDTTMVWVRKGDASSDANVALNGSSGV